MLAQSCVTGLIGTQGGNRVTETATAKKILWRKQAGYDIGSSDRVSEQHIAEVGKILLVVEAHKWDEAGEAHIYPRWAVWFVVGGREQSTYLNDFVFDTEAEAKAEAENLVAAFA